MVSYSGKIWDAVEEEMVPKDVMGRQQKIVFYEIK